MKIYGFFLSYIKINWLDLSSDKTRHHLDLFDWFYCIFCCLHIIHQIISGLFQQKIVTGHENNHVFCSAIVFIRLNISSFLCAGGENHRLTWGLVLRTSVYGWQRILHLAKTGQKGNIQLKKYIFAFDFLLINPLMLTILEMEESPFYTF